MTEQDRGPRDEPDGASGGTSDGATGDEPFLYVIVCAAGLAADVGLLIAAARRRGWAVGVIATPTAQADGFFDVAAVEALTGRPVRARARRPGEPRPFPAPDAVLVAPATFNTLNKWAAGIADTLALGTLCEAYGLGVPLGALPCVGDALAAHPAYRESLARLRAMGVRFGPPYPGQPGQPGNPAESPWEQALDLVERRGQDRSQPTVGPTTRPPVNTS